MENVATVATDSEEKIEAEKIVCESSQEEMITTVCRDKGEAEKLECVPSQEEMTLATEHEAEEKCDAECIETKIMTVAHKQAEKTANCIRSREHRHAVVFYNNWIKSEKANLQLISMKDIKITQQTCRKGSFGVCHIGTYGTNCVAVKKN